MPKPEECIRSGIAIAQTNGEVCEALMSDRLTVTIAFKHIAARAVVIQNCIVCALAKENEIRRKLQRTYIIAAVGEVDDAALLFRGACGLNCSLNSRGIILCIGAICTIGSDIKDVVPCKIIHPCDADIQRIAALGNDGQRLICDKTAPGNAVIIGHFDIVCAERSLNLECNGIRRVFKNFLLRGSETDFGRSVSAKLSGE